MTSLDIWNLCLILGGVVLMVLAAFKAKVVVSLTRGERYETAWRVLFVFMSLFCVAYLMAGFLVVMFGSHSLEMLSGTVFIGGAGFVMLVVYTSLGKMKELKKKKALLRGKLESADLALQAKAHKLKTITTCARDAIIMIDNRGEVTFFNPAAETMFGYRVDEIIGKNFHSIIVPEKFMDAHREGFAAFKDTGQGAAIDHISELEARRKDGTVFPVEVSLASIEISGLWCAVGTVRDITIRKQVDELIRESNDELESANQKLTQTVAELNAAMEQIQTLHGLIPICSHCHKIRNGADAWQRVDLYIQEHSDAKFSHSICDDCLEKRYPE